MQFYNHGAKINEKSLMIPINMKINRDLGAVLIKQEFIIKGKGTSNTSSIIRNYMSPISHVIKSYMIKNQPREEEGRAAQHDRTDRSIACSIMNPKMIFTTNYTLHPKAYTLQPVMLPTLMGSDSRWNQTVVSGVRAQTRGDLVHHVSTQHRAGGQWTHHILVLTCIWKRGLCILNVFSLRVIISISPALIRV